MTHLAPELAVNHRRPAARPGQDAVPALPGNTNLGKLGHQVIERRVDTGGSRLLVQGLVAQHCLSRTTNAR
eukprot:SAG22_NODE_21370_length_257_cov_1.126582_1_plen_70_part_01